MATATELKAPTAIDAKQLFNHDTTIWISCPKQRTGYLVSVNKHTYAIKAVRDWERLTATDKRSVRLWINSINQLHNYENPNCVDFDKCCTIGSWYDNGILYLDTCNWYKNLEDALKAAREQRQLAIYDLSNNEVINVE